jgi:stringent starvation protein B
MAARQAEGVVTSTVDSIVTSKPEKAKSEKADCFRALLGRGVTALHLDPRKPGVQVPEKFRSDPWLVLNYAYNFGLGDFTIDDDVVVATLSFNRRDFLCRVPWSAVFAITDVGRTDGKYWPEDVPPEVVSNRVQAADEAEGGEGGEAAEAAEAAKATKAAEVTTAPRRGHLRVVK